MNISTEGGGEGDEGFEEGEGRPGTDLAASPLTHPYINIYIYIYIL